MSNNILLLGDTHFGARNNSMFFHDYFRKCYDFLFEYCNNNNIKTIIQTGDLFDQRKAINIQTLYECRKYFFDRLRKYNIDLYAPVGNHDIYFKSTLEINSPSLLLNEYENVHIIDRPRELIINGISFLFLPWICDNNIDEVNQIIRKSKSKYMIAHLELSGFEMFAGQISHEGTDSIDLKKFEMVFTGHYHHQSLKNNIHYIGTFYETTWADYDDQKGFHIFSPDLKTTEFIENPHKVFKVLIYDETNLPKKLDQYSNSILKIIIVNKTDQYKFDTFIKKLETMNIHSIKIIDQELITEQTGIIIDAKALENTLNMMHTYIDESSAMDNKDSLKQYITTLYNQTISGEITFG